MYILLSKSWLKCKTSCLLTNEASTLVLDSWFASVIACVIYTYFWLGLPMPTVVLHGHTPFRKRGKGSGNLISSHL